MTNKEKTDEYVEVFVPMDKAEVLKRGLKHDHRRIGIDIFDGYLAKYPKKYAAEFERMIASEIRAGKRAKRCLIPNGKGGFIRCPERNKCRDCKLKDEFGFTTNFPLSLDQLRTKNTEEGMAFDIPDPHSDFTSDVETFIILADLLSFLEKNYGKPYRLIYEMMYDACSTAEIAKAFGLPWSTAKDTIKRIREIAQEHTGLTRD